MSGLIFNPLKNMFALHNSDLDVNYLLTATKG
jgi:2-polyprenyl-3-methyl-5-hydroxy-6-metoxy-1,4-benzoquinol methylase